MKTPEENTKVVHMTVVKLPDKYAKALSALSRKTKTPKNEILQKALEAYVSNGGSV